MSNEQRIESLCCHFRPSDCYSSRLISFQKVNTHKSIGLKFPSFELDFRGNVSSLYFNKVVKRLWFRKTNYDGCISKLSIIDWDRHTATHTCNDLVKLFYETLQSIIEKYTPKVKVKNSNCTVWFSDGLKRCLTSKTKHHARCKLFGKPRDWDTFSALRARSKLLLN